MNHSTGQRLSPMASWRRAQATGASLRPANTAPRAELVGAARRAPAAAANNNNKRSAPFEFD
jgi:hypothetical protein